VNVLNFAFERSIVNSALGIIAVLLVTFLFGKYLLIKIPNKLKRCFFYSAIGTFFIIFDYAFLNESTVSEFSKLPSWLIFILGISSLTWMFILIFPCMLWSDKRRNNKVDSNSPSDPSIKNPSISLSIHSTEEDIWAFVSNELNSQNRNEGLWAKCFASADGNADKAKAAYLKKRFDQIYSEIQVQNIETNSLTEISDNKDNSDVGSPAICPRCGGQISTTTKACNHCYAWLGGASKDKPIPRS
jgi:hypothetical protein